MASKTKHIDEDKLDRAVEKILDEIGKPKPIQRIRKNHFFSAIVGAAGLALFLVGVEKIFVALSGWYSIGLGLLLLAISGALFSKLN